MKFFSKLFGTKKNEDIKITRESLLSKEIPRHIAIIMDGNGRWAQRQGLPRTIGHKKGQEQVREIVSECKVLGIKTLTLYAFSTENWNRPGEEVSFLMSLFIETLQKEVDELHKNGVKIKFIGLHDRLSPELISLIKNSEEKTANNTCLQLNLAINYGSRSEIIYAIKELAEDVKSNRLSISEISENKLENYLFTSGQPDPDLIIRTSGEQRISNFLLWQAAYSEFIFVSVNWPDFNVEEFHKVISEYQNRKRRFGGLGKC